MNVDVQQIDRIAPTRRPEGRPCGYHRWTNLLFAHWSIDANVLAPLLPSRLTVDTFDGVAWVGVVPFHMSGVRPRGLPAVPGISAFHETNIRTYVHLDGRDPGVWFFSLDAASSLAVRIARRFWHLPYFRSRMTLNRNDSVSNAEASSNSTIAYTGKRLWPEPTPAEYTIRAEIGDAFNGESATSTGSALPDTFEHFLAERYVMYGETAKGQLLQGRVHHSPYPLREVDVVQCDESLTSALGLDLAGPPEHVLFSDGVAVNVFPMRKV